jgi:hypothetical protein
MLSRALYDRYGVVLVRSDVERDPQRHAQLHAAREAFIGSRQASVMAERALGRFSRWAREADARVRIMEHRREEMRAALARVTARIEALGGSSGRGGRRHQPPGAAADRLDLDSDSHGVAAGGSGGGDGKLEDRVPGHAAGLSDDGDDSDSEDEALADERRKREKYTTVADALRTNIDVDLPAVINALRAKCSRVDSELVRLSNCRLQAVRDMEIARERILTLKGRVPGDDETSGGIAAIEIPTIEELVGSMDDPSTAPPPLYASSHHAINNHSGEGSGGGGGTEHSYGEEDNMV